MGGGGLFADKGGGGKGIIFLRIGGSWVFSGD